MFFYVKGKGMDNIRNSNIKGLVWGIFEKDKEKIEWFLGKIGGDINAMVEDNKNLLMLACENGDVKVVDYLLSRRDINVRAENSEGYTSLMFAAMNGHIQISKSLLTKGALINKKTRLVGLTPLMLAISNHKADMAMFLMDQEKIDVSIKTTFVYQDIDKKGNVTPYQMTARDFALAESFDAEMNKVLKRLIDIEKQKNVQKMSSYRYLNRKKGEHER